MKSTFAHRCNFTLIELLVVIVSVLAAILFPVFTTAREKARKTACLSNEEQLGLAILQFLPDNDESLRRCPNDATPGYNINLGTAGNKSKMTRATASIKGRRLAVPMPT